jgi:hypothetical protein
MAHLRRLARAAALRLAAVVLGLGLAVVVLELGLRLLPVADPPRVAPVDASQPVFRFLADQRYLWSIGWDFAVVNRGRTNAAGFVNDQEYADDRESPLLAVVGDSYVEALMVPYPETLHGRLAEHLAGEVRVYSLAASGAPLSQYLVWAEHARDRFRPAGLAVVVVGNDFDESLSWYKTGPGFHHYVEGGDGGLELARFDYAPSPVGRLVRRSALARYLAFNLHAQTRLRALASRFAGQMDARADATPPGAPDPPPDTDETRPLPRFVGSTAADAEAARIAGSLRAIDAFLEDLPRRAGLPSQRIALVIDGMRPQLYEGRAAVEAVRDAYFPRMRDAFIERASRAGFEVVDLHPAFTADFREHGERFEFETDFHWNAAGHRVAAEALGSSRVLEAIRSGSPTPHAGRAVHREEKRALPWATDFAVKHYEATRPSAGRVWRWR